jgi:hypothetical protein
MVSFLQWPSLQKSVSKFMANKFYEVSLASLINVGWVAALVIPENTYIQPFFP